MVSFAKFVEMELTRARESNPPISSVHAGYAIILEELDEFWEEVRKKPGVRREQDMMQELVQIAAMAQRVAEDLSLVETYRPR